MDPAYRDLSSISESKRDIVSWNVDDEAKYILVIPILSESERDEEIDESGNVIPEIILFGRILALYSGL